MSATDEPIDSQEVTTVTALEAQERASVDVQVATAKRYPRNLSTCRKRLMDMATIDQDTAAGCFYTLTRKDNKSGEKKLIQGPSIRLAEIAMTSFGNIAAGARIVENDGKNITAQGVCHDTEANVRIVREVRRRITDRNGRTYSEDMQNVTANAACSIALRNAICTAVPRIFINQAYEAAKKVAAGDAKSLSTRFQQVVKHFGQWGKDQADLLAWLDKSDVSELTMDDVTALIGLGTAIKDGETTLDKEFGREAGAPARDGALPRKAATPPPPAPPAAVSSGDAQHSSALREQVEEEAEPVHAADDVALLMETAPVSAEPPKAPAPGAPVDACPSYLDLLEISRKSPAMLKCALGKMGKRGLADVDHTDQEACAEVVTEFLRIKKNAKG